MDEWFSQTLFTICDHTDLDVASHNLLLLGVLGLHHGVAGGVLGGEELVGAGRHVGLHGLLVGLAAPLHVVDEGVLEALVALSLSIEGNKSVENKKTVKPYLASSSALAF